MSKKWWTSKTEWINLLTLIAFVVTLATGVAIDDGAIGEVAAAIIAVINIVVRFRTNTALVK